MVDRDYCREGIVPERVQHETRRATRTEYDDAREVCRQRVLDADDSYSELLRTIERKRALSRDRHIV